MLGSDFLETLIQRDVTDALRAKKLAVCIGGIACALLTFLLAFSTGLYLLLFLTAAIGFAIWLWLGRQRVEYEYVFTACDLSIDKLFAERKRKPLLAVSLNDVTAFGKLKDAQPTTPDQTLVLACAVADDTAYYADIAHSNVGSIRLVMTLDERTLDYVLKHLPRAIRFRWNSTKEEA